MLRPLSLISAAVIAFAPQAYAQDAAADYPNKPVRVLVSVPPGGGVDTVTRLISDKLRERLGQPFVVDNRGGAGGNLAAEVVYNAAPDGYQLLASQPAPITTNVVLYKKLNFDPTRFEPIVVMSTIPNVLLVKNDFPAKDAKEFLEYLRGNPGKINYASQGPGTTSHLTAELLQKLTGTSMVHVPYKGTGPALNDIVAGHVDMIFMQLQAAIRLHQAGKARILAVTVAKRIPELPEVPTMGEVGVKGLISDTWNALSAPPKTPAPIVNKLNAVVNEILKTPEIVARYKKALLTPTSMSPEETRAFVKEDTDRWSEVIRSAKIPPI